MSSEFLVKSLYILIAIIFLLYTYKRYRFTPPLVFVGMQLLMFIGIRTAPQANSAWGIKLTYIYFFTLIFFIIGVIFSNALHKKHSLKTHKTNKIIESVNDKGIPTKSQYFIIIGLVVLSILLCTWFYAQSGGNLLIKSIKDFFSSTEVNYSNERRQFFGISGTGYIYQFRVVILPILNIFLVFGQPRKNYKKFGIIITPLTLLFLLGTGQRNAFVFMLLFLFVYIFVLKTEFRQQINYNLLVVLVSFSIFFLIVLTISNGRVSEEDNLIIGALESLLDRITGVNSRTALSAFKYIDTQPTVWGYDWLMMLADILPGKSGYLSVDRIVYYLSYGTYNGTGPPCIWGSAWYNWSYFGATLFPLILGIIYQNIYYIFKRRDHTKLNSLIYIALVVYFGIWFCGSPMVLFNNGVVTILILSFILNIFKNVKLIITWGGTK